MRELLLTAGEAESLVAKALEGQGWLLLARNFRHIGCELDLVVRKGQTTVVCEVKRRRWPPRSLADGEMLLPWRKRVALMRGARVFLSRRREQPETIRFDLAVVHGTKARPMIAYFVNVLA